MKASVADVVSSAKKVAPCNNRSKRSEHGMLPEWLESLVYVLAELGSFE